MVIVNLHLAIICFVSGGIYECHPALVGHDTPVGQYQMAQRLTSQAGYGGDVLQFKETADSWYAIHRVWTLKPEERRTERLNSSDPVDRRTITKGCINIDPKVYEQLRSCCSSHKLVITQ